MFLQNFYNHITVKPVKPVKAAKAFLQRTVLPQFFLQYSTHITGAANKIDKTCQTIPSTHFSPPDFLQHSTRITGAASNVARQPFHASTILPGPTYDSNSSGRYPSSPPCETLECVACMKGKDYKEGHCKFLLSKPRIYSK